MEVGWHETKTCLFSIVSDDDGSGATGLVQLQAHSLTLADTVDNNKKREREKKIRQDMNLFPPTCYYEIEILTFFDALECSTEFSSYPFR